MQIRKSRKSDFETIKKIYETAREYMQKNGNPNQWGNSYPDDSIIINDINNEISYVLEDNGVIYGVFVYFSGEEPSYKNIENGDWHSKKQYGTIHRVASSGTAKGITKMCFDFCLEKNDYLRIDTHNDNKSMQSALKKYGFRECGIIHVRDGERIAFDYLK